MPIWSFTQERLDKLRKQIEAKKEEHDELEAKSEKGLWCKDLDDFLEEWHNQLRLDEEIQTNIRRLGRRVSKKIGAGKGRKKGDDDDFLPKKPARAPKPIKVETKTHERFAEKFGATSKPKSQPSTFGIGGASDDSDDDFATLGKGKAASKPAATESAPADDAGNGRTKRAAASKAKAWIDDDEDDDDSLLDNIEKMGDVGDVDAMVKGIGEPKAPDTAGRLSLFAMSRPQSSHGANGGISKPKSKPSKTFDLDDLDDTNYEMLARPSSPQKSTKGNDVDDFLSDDDELPAVTKMTATAKASSSQAASAAPKAPLSVVPAPAKKARGRPAGAKTKPKEDTAAKKPKQTTLSPAAKAYAAKKAAAKAKKVVSDDEDEDDEIVMKEPDSPAPRAAARPGRRAAAAKSKPIYIDDDDDSMAGGADDFSMDDSD